LVPVVQKFPTISQSIRLVVPSRIQSPPPPESGFRSTRRRSSRRNDSGQRARAGDRRRPWPKNGNGVGIEAIGDGDVLAGHAAADARPYIKPLASFAWKTQRSSVACVAWLMPTAPLLPTFFSKSESVIATVPVSGVDRAG
jgi:hypothetical protein